jgi:uncharacterized protein
MSFASVPLTAAWQHLGDRTGFEVAYFQAGDSGCYTERWTTTTEGEETWVVEYAIANSPGRGSGSQVLQHG